MGPNCLGIIYSGNSPGGGINTFFVPEEKFSIDFGKETNVAILSQSGALGLIEIENLKNAISPRVIVSYGNQLDVDPCDLVNYFQKDPAVDVIGCYIEGFKPRMGRKFFNVAGSSQKPVIVYKAGRTEEGRKATQSHTASIAGEYAVAKAAMKQAGLIVADTMIDHGDLVKTFALLSDFSVSGNRVVVIANAGYEKTIAADNLGQMRLAVLDDTTRKTLQDILPPMVVADPLLDLTPMADDATFEKCIQTVLTSDAVDALLVSVVPQSALLHTTDEEIQRNPDNIAARIIRLVHRHKKPHCGVGQRDFRSRCGIQRPWQNPRCRRGAHFPDGRPRHVLPECLCSIPAAAPSWYLRGMVEIGTFEPTRLDLRARGLQINAKIVIIVHQNRIRFYQRSWARRFIQRRHTFHTVFISFSK